MDRPTDPGARRLRGGLLVGLAALLSAVGHLAGGGSPPDLALLAVLAPALAWPVVAVADRCRGTAATVAVLGGGQLLLHELLTATAHAHHQADGPAMPAMHALVTAATAAGLRFADRGAAAVAAALRRVVPRRSPAPRVDRPLPVLAVPDTAASVLGSGFLAATHVRRGPPACC
jgi:hypothetical protein